MCVVSMTSAVMDESRIETTSVNILLRIIKNSFSYEMGALPQQGLSRRSLKRCKMRRSIIKFMEAAALAASATTPAWAAPRGTTAPLTLPAPSSPCAPSALTLTTPGAIDCVGYFDQNQLQGSNIADQQAFIAMLQGNPQWDGDWNGIPHLEGQSDLSGPNGDRLDFGVTMFGLTVIGAHWGNVPDLPEGNVSVFWLFDFGDEGADFVTLNNTAGWSNAALYLTNQPPGVPEPATWAMMLMGFGVAGAALRRSRRKNGMIAQIA
jgi:hypothetical protein